MAVETSEKSPKIRHRNKKNKMKKEAEAISLASSNQGALEKQIAIVKKQIKNKKPGTGSLVTLKKGVVYLGHIPHGFYEAQIKDYMNQFGTVSKLRVSRSKRTMRSRGYAFIEFESEDAARVVAETMNNYLMFEHILKCEFIPEERVHPAMFNNFRKIMKPDLNPILAKRQYNSMKSEESLVKSEQRMVKGLLKRKLQLEAMGIEFNTDLVLNKSSKADTKFQTPAPPSAKRPKKMRTPQQLLEIDSSEDEISFKTPPNALKVKRSKSKNMQKTSIIA